MLTGLLAKITEAIINIYFRLPPSSCHLVQSSDLFLENIAKVTVGEIS